MRPIPSGAAAFVAKFEGVRLTAYQDSVGVWTIGYGHTGPDVFQGCVWDERWALVTLAKDLEKAAGRIDAIVPTIVQALSDNQYSALLSFVFNVGANPKWGLWKVLRSRAFDKVPSEIQKFHYAGGKSLPGLVKRRAAEAALWASSLPAKPPLPVIGLVAPVSAVVAPAVILAAKTHSPILPVVLGIALALALAWVVITLIRTHRNKPMSVSSDIQPIVDALNAEAATIAAAIAAAGSAGNAALQAELDTANASLATEQQNHTDDVAALQAALDAVKAAVPTL